MSPERKAAAIGEKAKRKQEMSQKAKRYDNKDEYRQNPDGSTSTHKMAYATIDKGAVAFPTVFPKERGGTKSHDPKDWIEPEGWAALDTAKARGEVYQFSKERRAKKWSEGGYKKVK